MLSVFSGRRKSDSAFLRVSEELKHLQFKDVPSDTLYVCRCASARLFSGTQAL
jgi:hypothetical protein